MPSGTQQVEIYTAVPGLQDTLYFEEGLSQTFKKGWLVRLSRAGDAYDGQIIACGGTAASQGNDEMILGIAQKDATGTNGSSIPVTPIIPNVTILSMTAFDNDTAGDCVTDYGEVGKAVGIIRCSTVADPVSTAGHFVADLENTSYTMASTKQFKIIGIDPRWAEGTAYGKYLVMLRTTCSDLNA